MGYTTLVCIFFMLTSCSAKILYVQGRQHPVTVYHTASSQPDYVDAALRTFFQIHTDQPPGDVLIFLPGQEDIENLDKSIKLYADRLPKDASGVWSRTLTCDYIADSTLDIRLPCILCMPLYLHINKQLSFPLHPKECENASWLLILPKRPLLYLGSNM